eukprot:scaffold301_cov243-Pinguiococcus_pyrenoidosus.AAC.176
MSEIQRLAAIRYPEDDWFGIDLHATASQQETIDARRGQLEGRCVTFVPLLHQLDGLASVEGVVDVPDSRVVAGALVRCGSRRQVYARGFASVRGTGLDGCVPRVRGRIRVCVCVRGCVRVRVFAHVHAHAYVRVRPGV